MNAAQSRWRRRFVSMLTERIGLKAVALAFALVLWFIVTSKEPTEEIVPVQLTLTLDSGYVLREPPPDIHALIAGEGKAIFALFATPPAIRRHIPAGKDSVTITLSPDDLEIPRTVLVLVRDIQPRSFTVHVVPRVTTR